MIQLPSDQPLDKFFTGKFNVFGFNQVQRSSIRPSDMANKNNLRFSVAVTLTRQNATSFIVHDFGENEVLENDHRKRSGILHIHDRVPINRVFQGGKLGSSREPNANFEKDDARFGLNKTSLCTFCSMRRNEHSHGIVMGRTKMFWNYLL